MFRNITWELLEHMRIAQWDILEFSRSARHVSPKWPDGYWPETAELPNDEAWDESIEWYGEDLKLMLGLILDPKVDLHARILHGDGQTLLREGLTLATHNSWLPPAQHNTATATFRSCVLPVPVLRSPLILLIRDMRGRFTVDPPPDSHRACREVVELPYTSAPPDAAGAVG